MAQNHGNPFLQEAQENAAVYGNQVHLPAGNLAAHQATAAAAAANGNHGAPPPQFPPGYVNLISALIQAAAAHGGAQDPPPQLPAFNDEALGALVQAAGGDQARRRGAAGNGSDARRGAALDGVTGPETFTEQLAKAKSVLTQPFVFTSLVHSLVISFSLSARGSEMSLVNGRPVDSIAHAFVSGPDKWKTTTPLGLAILCLAFLVILMAHFYLVTHLMMRRPVGAPVMHRHYSFYVPLMLTLATQLYFLAYINLARYEVTTVEWILLGVFSAVLLCGSINIILCTPVRQDRVVVTQRVHTV